MFKWFHNSRIVLLEIGKSPVKSHKLACRQGSLVKPVQRLHLLAIHTRAIAVLRGVVIVLRGFVHWQLADWGRTRVEV